MQRIVVAQVSLLREKSYIGKAYSSYNIIWSLGPHCNDIMGVSICATTPMRILQGVPCISLPIFSVRSEPFPSVSS